MKKLLVTGSALAGAGLLVGGYLYASLWPTSQIFGRTLVAGADLVASAGNDPARHTVALTYDDGPSPRNTPALLDLLAEFEVTATFFMMGDHVRRHTAVARRVVAAGHVIGNHTETHPRLSRCTPVRVRQELETCQKTMEDLLDVSPVLFRPPYGARRPDVLLAARSMGLTPVLWNSSARDWLSIGSNAMQGKVDRDLARNQASARASTVLLHDGSHLDRDAPLSRGDTIAVTRTLLTRDSYRFATPLEWLPDDRRT